MTKIAAVVAVEDYLHLPKVDFAVNDGRAIYDQFAYLGFDVRWSRYNDEVTCNWLDNFFNTVSNDIAEDDEFCFFFAGHGFHFDTNYLAPFDTEYGDPPKRLVALKPLITALQSRKVKTSIFLDTCHSGLALSDSNPFSVEELTFFKGKSEQFACFSSCTTTEKSYPDGERTRGLWSFYLSEAFAGDVEAMDPKPFITANSLHKFLNSKVTTRATALGKIQNPHLTLAQTKEFFVADLSAQFAERERITIKESTVRRVHFQKKDSVLVRRLAGFNTRGHIVPTYINSKTRNFIEKIASSNIEEIGNGWFENIKEHFDFTRSDLDTRNRGGDMAIWTPLFDFCVNIEQEDADPRRATFFERFTLLPQNLSVAATDKFDQLVGNRFAELIFDLSEDLFVDELIDAFEKANFVVKYQPDCQWMTVHSAASGVDLTIFPRRVIIERDYHKPSMLLKAASTVFTEFSASTSLSVELSQTLKSMIPNP